MYTRKMLKEKAKSAFKSNYWWCVLIALIMSVILGGGVSIASLTGLKTNTTLTTESNNSGKIMDTKLDINGVVIDPDSFTGDDISKALDSLADSLDSGDLTVNGEKIDVSDKEEVEDLKEAIQSLQGLNLSGYSHNDIIHGIARILAVLGVVLVFFGCMGELVKIFGLNPLLVGGDGFFLVNTEEKAQFSEMKRGFTPNYLHNVGTMLLMDIFRFLWSLLFIIPGIIKAYSYCMVPFILADNPNLGARETINLSRKMMKGHKWRTFVLDLSFLGWIILSGLTLGLLGVFYVNPYMHATHAELYKTLKEGIGE